MKDKHIIEILDRASIVMLSESELNEIRVHALECMSFAPFVSTAARRRTACSRH